MRRLDRSGLLGFELIELNGPIEVRKGTFGN
jgi:hypothetical protein